MKKSSLIMIEVNVLKLKLDQQTLSIYDQDQYIESKEEVQFPCFCGWKSKFEGTDLAILLQEEDRNRSLFDCVQEWLESLPFLNFNEVLNSLVIVF